MNRFDKPQFAGGLFLSYSREDERFAEHLRAAILNAGLSCWMDKHDAPAGPIQHIVTEAIRSRDVVVLILSRHSLCSDWVWHEVHTAREKEKREQRTILCPVAIDNAWEKPDEFDRTVQHAVHDHQVELGDLKRRYNIIPFGGDTDFDVAFQKLIRGIVEYYAPPQL